MARGSPLNITEDYFDCKTNLVKLHAVESWNVLLKEKFVNIKEGFQRRVPI